jgi:hypothetical protein
MGRPGAFPSASALGDRLNVIEPAVLSCATPFYFQKKGLKRMLQAKTYTKICL